MFYVSWLFTVRLNTSRGALGAWLGWIDLLRDASVSQGLKAGTDIFSALLAQV